MSHEDALHINFRPLSQIMGMMRSPDHPLWQRGVDLIRRGADQPGETLPDKVPVEELIGSAGTPAVSSASFSVNVSEEVLESIKL